MNASMRGKSLAQICMRKFVRTQIYRRYSDPCKAKIAEVPCKGLKELKEKQKKFQLDNGLPVHLKGGAKDKILYQVTLVLIFTGLGMSLYTLVIVGSQMN